MSNEYHNEVVVIGAGFGGVGMGVKLKEIGFDDFVILEKAGDVGGTWRDNTYPGLTVDVPTITYSYSFAQKPDWSSFWAPQPELLQYCRQVTDTHGLRPYIRFNAKVASSTYDRERNLWVTRTEGGPTYVSRYLVTATGFLSVPRWPDIEGLDSFKGKMIHTSSWDHDFDFSGKRVGFIGTGATGVQLIPEVADLDPKQLSVFQRTPIWLMPKPDMTLSKSLKLAFKYVPGLMALGRFLTAIFMDMIFHRTFTKYRQVEWFARKIEQICISHLRAQVEDPELQEKLIPDYDWGCKRPSFSNRFYPVFNRPNVELVTDSISKVTAKGIVTADGTERPLDVLICATGYAPWAKDSLPTYPIYGKDGVELTDVWEEDHYQAFRGVAINNYPNYFMICGPYSIAHSSYIGMVETATKYIGRLLQAAHSRGANFVEVKADAQAEEYQDILRKRKREIFFAGNCATANTYYYDRFGDTPNFRPSSHPRVWADARFGLSVKHFDIKRVRANAAGRPPESAKAEKIVSSR